MEACFSPGPISVTMSPEQPRFEFSQCHRASDNGQPASPLVFMRTPGINGHEDACPDSSKRFSAWLQSTSPYTGGSKTPPTVSMKSMAAGAENTPPPGNIASGVAEKGRSSAGSQQHFQAWLSATNSTRWTPRKSPAAATPPPAPAPSPAGTPMSIMRDITHSAATPPTSTRLRQLQQGVQQARMPAPAAAAGDGFDTSDDEDGDAGEASTTIGAAQLAAAADRAAGLRAHSGSSGQQVRPRQLSTPPRVPAPSPVINSPLALGQQQQSLLQAATDRMMHSSLLTPMSNLSISRKTQAQQASLTDSATPPVGRSMSRGPDAEAAVGSPAEKLIGLMLSPGGEGRRRHHPRHHEQQQQRTPSRLSAALGAARGGDDAQQAPLSPNLQVIDLMMQAVDSGSAGAAPQGGLRSADGAAGEAAATAAEAQAGADAGSDFGSGASSYGAGSETESGDELDLSELQALCGEALAPGTPLSMILGMMITPEAAAGLTPQMDAEQQQQQQSGNADIGPRVLFADD